MGHEIRQFNHIGLFEGIGGFSLAARWMGWETIATCEINDFCNNILKYHFPNAKQHYDIKQTDFTIYRGKCDILTGGFPCQDISIAGIKNGRKGLQGERSGLFYEMIRAIDEIKPKFIIYENSPMIRGEILKQVHNELTKIGYVYNWGKIITARHLGYPHKRARYYGVSFANSDSFGRYEITNFNNEFEKIYKSEEIFRMQKTNKAEFNRTFSTSLRMQADNKFLRSFDGISDKMDADSIKALGNAVIPDMALLVFKAIEQYNKKYFRQ